MPLVIHSTTVSNQKGTGLTEVLVTLLVLSIGFSASAALQLTSIRANQSTLYRSLAATVFESVMDRMRNNPVGLASGRHDNVSTKNASAPGACADVKCSPSKLASEDIAQWRHSFSPMDGSFPKLTYSSGGSPAVGHISAPVNGVYSIELNWEALEDGELVMQSLAMSFIP